MTNTLPPKSDREVQLEQLVSEALEYFTKPTSTVDVRDWVRAATTALRVTR